MIWVITCCNGLVLGLWACYFGFNVTWSSDLLFEVLACCSGLHLLFGLFCCAIMLLLFSCYLMFVFVSCLICFVMFLGVFAYFGFWLV